MEFAAQTESSRVSTAANVPALADEIFVAMEDPAIPLLGRMTASRDGTVNLWLHPYVDSSELSSVSERNLLGKSIAGLMFARRPTVKRLVLLDGRDAVIGVFARR